MDSICDIGSMVAAPFLCRRGTRKIQNVSSALAGLWTSTWPGAPLAVTREKLGSGAQLDFRFQGQCMFNVSDFLVRGSSYTRVRIDKLVSFYMATAVGDVIIFWSCVIEFNQSVQRTQKENCSLDQTCFPGLHDFSRNERLFPEIIIRSTLQFVWNAVINLYSFLPFWRQPSTKIQGAKKFA